MRKYLLLTAIARLIRERWHPLWRMRRSPLFRRLQAALDRTVYRKLPDTGIFVAVRLIRDASWLIGAQNLEPEIRVVFQAVLGIINPAVFWDIGANLGFYSWFVRQYPSIESVVMFEPDPLNFALLNATIRKNGISNCRALNLAVSDKNGEDSFIVDLASGAAGSLELASQRTNEASLQHSYSLDKTIRCRTMTIDTLISAGERPPQLIKIDVEGAERLVIAGGEASLRQYQPSLILETFDRTVVDHLRCFGYVPFPIDMNNFLLIAASRMQELEAVRLILSQSLIGTPGMVKQSRM